jgi:phosphoribosylanthranilate isomerase
MLFMLWQVEDAVFLMRRTRIKICGITRVEDGVTAAQLGADAIGLVFYAKSSRFVDVVTAAQIIQALPPFVTTVGLFVDAETAQVEAIMRQVCLGMLQFHGNEDPAYCASYGIPFMKAVPMGTATDLVDYGRRFQQAAGLLLDSHGGDKTGGSGQCFDWQKIPKNIAKPIVLAGGLDPNNVVEAIQQVQPFAVDVSSGVESAKGVKDSRLMQQFIESVKRGDSLA